MTVAVVLLAFVILLLIYVLWSRRKYYAFSLKMPGPFGLPFIGIAHRLHDMEELLYSLPKLAAEYNTKTFFTFLGPYPVIYSTEPKIVEIVLNSPDCLNKPLVYDVVHDAIGDGLLTSKTPKWNARRKLFNPAFSYKLLLNFVPNFNNFSRELCEKLEEVVDCGEVNIKEFTFSFALKSSVATTMGYEFPKGSTSTFLNDFERVLEITVDRLLKPWLRNSFIFKRTTAYKSLTECRGNVVNFVNELIINKMKLQGEKLGEEVNAKEEIVNIEKENHIFIERAIKIHQRNEMSFDDIATEANLMVGAGTETTATSLFTILFHLAMYPEYQDRVFEEILSVFPDEEFDVTNEDFKQLTFLDMCINEALRVTSAIPVIARVCTKDVPISEDLVIPKDTQIYFDIFNMHRDKDVWGPDAHIFNPDHFLPSNLVDKSPYSFVPFSKGQRNCIGWQYARIVLRITLVQVLRKYRFTTKYRLEDIKCMLNIALKLQPLPYLEVHRR